MGPDAMILVFWTLSFKATFSLSSFPFFMWLLSPSLLSAIRVVSSSFLRLLIFLPGNLEAFASFSPAFHMMYSAYKLNKQGDNIQPWLTPSPIWNQSVVPCPVLTVASWPAYRFLRSPNIILILKMRICAYVCAKSLQSCPTLCNAMDCSPPGSSVHGISRARIMEQVAISSTRRSFQPRDQTHFCGSCIGRQVLYHWDILYHWRWEQQGLKRLCCLR